MAAMGIAVMTTPTARLLRCACACLCRVSFIRPRTPLADAPSSCFAPVRRRRPRRLPAQEPWVWPRRGTWTCLALRLGRPSPCRGPGATSLRLHRRRRTAHSSQELSVTRRELTLAPAHAAGPPCRLLLPPRLAERRPCGSVALCGCVPADACLLLTLHTCWLPRRTGQRGCGGGCADCGRWCRDRGGRLHLLRLHPDCASASPGWHWLSCSHAVLGADGCVRVCRASLSASSCCASRPACRETPSKRSQQTTSCAS